MKIKLGFISNSSSTSFLIRYDKNNFNKCSCCGRSDETIKELAELEERAYSDTEVDYIKEDNNIVEIKLECSIHGLLHKIIMDMAETGKINIIEEEEL